MGWDKRSGGRKERLLSASATADCQEHPRVAASGKSGSLRRRGSGPRSFTRVFYRLSSDLEVARRSHSASLWFCAFILRPQLAPANGVVKPAARSLHSSRS